MKYLNKALTKASEEFEDNKFVNNFLNVELLRRLNHRLYDSFKIKNGVFRAKNFELHTLDGGSLWHKKTGPIRINYITQIENGGVIILDVLAGEVFNEENYWEGMYLNPLSIKKIVLPDSSAHPTNPHLRVEGWKRKR